LFDHQLTCCFLEGAFVTGFVAVAVVYETGNINSTVAGMVLLYAMNFTGSITFVTRMHGECQMSMNSVERVMEYLEVEKENYDDANEQDDISLQELKRDISNYDIEMGEVLGPMSSSYGWPSTGCLEFRQIEMRYRVSDAPVLK